MPNCFQLTRKTEMEKGPVKLSVIDKELCEMLGKEVDDDRYVGGCRGGWFMYIGWKLAMGVSFQEISDGLVDMLKEMEDDGSGEIDPQAVNDAKEMLTICEYLNKNFVSDCFVSR